jgi:hypothetical protein
MRVRDSNPQAALELPESDSGHPAKEVLRAF